MKTWLRLTLITMTVGGGFTGFVIALSGLFRPQSSHVWYFLLVIAALGLYGFVTASGLLFVQNPARTTPLLIALALQVPWISSPLMSYRFTAGFHLTVGFVGGGFNGGYRLGSDWQFTFLQKVPLGLGINIVAVVMIALLARAIWKERSGPY